MSVRKKAETGGMEQFPPEADGEFDVVPEAEIEAWRQKLNEKYGIGTGKLRVIDDPAAA